MLYQEHGGEIYTGNYRLDFSANLNPLGMPDSVKAAVRQASELADRYPDAQCRELRRALSEVCRLPEEYFLCGNGAAELIMASAQALKPRRALIALPAFSEYERALKSAGCAEIRYYSCLRSRGFRIGEDILDYISPDIDMVFLCNPANPTGLLTDHELLRKIAEYCREKGVLLVLDECFNALLQDPAQATLLKELPENPKLMILRAFTKSYAMAGLRLGYAVSSCRELLARIRASLQTWNVSLPAQLAGIAALKERGYLERAGKLICTERLFLREKLSAMGFLLYDSQANYLFFEGPEDLAERCAEKGILIRDCGSCRGLAPGCFRIAVKRREENEALCACLEAVIREDKTPSAFGLPAEGRAQERQFR